jgi:hypothetical protein
MPIRWLLRWSSCADWVSPGRPSGAGRAVFRGSFVDDCLLEVSLSDERSSGPRAVTLSHKLPVLPFVAKALETDDLSFDQAQVFTHIPEHLSEDLAADEVMLVNAASPLTRCRHPPLG